MTGALSQCEVPCFGHQAFSAEAVVRLFCGQREARLLIQSPGLQELALRPQRNLAIARLSREAHAFIDEASTDAETTRRRLHVQQSKLGHSVRLADKKDRTDDLAVLFGNPAALLG